MFVNILFVYFLVGIGMAIYWGRGETPAALVVTAGLLSSLSLILPLAKGVPGFVGLLYVRTRDKERSIHSGGLRKPFVGNWNLIVPPWEDRALLARTVLHDVLVALAWLFTLYILLGHGIFGPLLRFWKNVLLWLPRLWPQT